MDLKKLFLIVFLFPGLLVAAGAVETAPEVLEKFSQAKTLVEEDNYALAEQIYQSIVSDYPGSDSDLKAKKKLVELYISTKRSGDAQAGINRLMADFSGNPLLPAALCYIAKRYMQAKDHAQATALYQTVVINFPDSSEALRAKLNLSELDILTKIESGQVVEAQAATDKLISDSSDQHGIRGRLSRIAKGYKKEKQYDRATDLLQGPGTDFSDPNDVLRTKIDLSELDILAKIRSGRNEEAQAATEKLILDSNDQYGIKGRLSHIARRYRKTMEYEDSGDVYESILEDHPDSKSIHKTAINLALADILALIHAGQMEAAAQEIETLKYDFSYHPMLDLILRRIAKKYENVSEYEKADNLHQGLAEVHPEKAQLDRERLSVLSLIASGQTAAVETAIDTIIADYHDCNDFPRIMSRIQQGYFRMIAGGQVSSEEGNLNAILMWERVKEQVPDFSYNAPWPTYFIACSYYQLKEYETAIQLYKKVAAERPDYQQIIGAVSLTEECYAGLVEQGTATEEEARAEIDQLFFEIMSSPLGNKTVKYECLSRGRKAFAEGQWQEAVRYFELYWQIFYLEPESWKVARDLGESYENMEQTDLAVSVYLDYLETADLNSPFAKILLSRLGVKI